MYQFIVEPPSLRLVRSAIHLSAVATLALGLICAPALAVPLQCSIKQITNGNAFGTREGYPSINADGTRVAFQSTGELVGENADGNVEVFLYDATSGVTTQITHTTGGCERPRPSIDGGGTRIAFTSCNDLTGTNADGDGEIFVYDTVSHNFVQITNSVSQGSKDDPSFSADGNRIAFSSGVNLLGTNPEGHFEIYRYTMSNGVLEDLTKATAGFGSFSPSSNADGTRVAFHSSANIGGSAADDSFDIFLYNNGPLVAVTNASGDPGQDITQAVINGNGSRIAFQSKLNLVGANSDGNSEIFLYNKASGITQISNTLFGEIAASFGPAINKVGQRIAFISNFTLDLFDTTDGTLTHVTAPETQDANLMRPAINANGNRVVFSSRHDVTGGNPDGFDELFLASCQPATCNGQNATLAGTPGDDELTGTAGADVINGLGGNDTIRGAGGNDTLCGDTGNDKLYGGNDADTLLGGAGKDRLFGQGGGDTLNGGTGTDHCDGGGGDDTADASCETKVNLP